MCPLGVTSVYLDLNVGDVLGIRYAFLVCENLERKSGVEILPWVVVNADRLRPRVMVPFSVWPCGGRGTPQYYWGHSRFASELEAD